MLHLSSALATLHAVNVRELHRIAVIGAQHSTSHSKLKSLLLGVPHMKHNLLSPSLEDLLSGYSYPNRCQIVLQDFDVAETLK